MLQHQLRKLKLGLIFQVLIMSPFVPRAFAYYKFVAHTQEFIRSEVKPKTQIKLREGILRFWRIVTVSKCRQYINHLRKVILEVGGEATDY